LVKCQELTPKRGAVQGGRGGVHAEVDHDPQRDAPGQPAVEAPMPREGLTSNTAAACFPLSCFPLCQIVYAEFDGRPRKRVLVKIIG
jgi:hypothetical protein